MADNYVAHTQMTDQLGEAMADDLAELTPEESGRLVQAAMNNGGEASLRDAPASLRAFFEDAETPRNGSTLRRSPRASGCSTGTRR